MSYGRIRREAEPGDAYQRAANQPTVPAFLDVGAHGALLAAHDWSATPLGPVQGWPQSLKTTLATVLRSPVPQALLWGEAGTMLYNQSYAALIGRRHPDALGMPLREAWPEVADFNIRVMRTVLAGQTLSYVDQELALDREGRLAPAFFDLNYSPVVDEAGRPVGVLALVIETTERVSAGRDRDAAEAGLVRREAHWRGLFEQLYEGLILGEVVRDEAGRGVDWAYLEVNPAFGRLVGMTPENALGRTVREVFPGIEEVWVEHMVGVVETGGAATFVDRVGSVDRWYEGHAFPLGGDRFAVMFMEVTGRIATERRLRRYRRRLETALQVARLGTFEWNPATGALDLDARGREAFGLPAGGRLRAGDVLSLVASETAERVRAEAEAAVAASARAEITFDIVTPTGDRRSIDSMGHVFEDDGETRMIGVLADVTERREFEDRLQLLNRELHHRVNNLFSVLKGLVSSSARHERDPKAMAAKLRQRIDALAAAHMVSMEDGEERPNALDWIVRTISSPYEQSSGRLRANGPAIDLPQRAITPLGLILHELATNAVKHGAWSHENGSLEVAWEREATFEGTVLALSWNERSAMPVAPPVEERASFGTRLIDVSVQQLGGSIERIWKDDGLTVSIRFPVP